MTFEVLLLPKEQKKEAKEKCNFETIKIYVGRGDVNTLMAYMSLNSDSSTNRMILPSDDDVTNSKKKARIIRPLAWKECICMSFLGWHHPHHLGMLFVDSQAAKRQASAEDTQHKVRRAAPSSSTLFAHDTNILLFLFGVLAFELLLFVKAFFFFCLSLQLTFFSLFSSLFSPSFTNFRRRMKCQQCVRKNYCESDGEVCALGLLL